MPSKGTGWSTTDPQTGFAICRFCRRPASYKPISECPSGHYLNYERQKGISREFYQQHKNTILDKARIRSRLTHQKSRERCILYYGGKCACCGYADINKKIGHVSFLQMDHINGSGKAHRMSLSVGGHLYAWLIHNGFPEGFRVLCAPCNSGMIPGETTCELHKWEKGN